MIKITAINFMGESLELSPDKYAIKKVTGLSPQGGTISTQKMARHGTEFNNSTTDERNIVIDLRILGDVEANRDALYNAFPTSLPVTLVIETDKKMASIVGYVETCEVDFFEVITVGQISIICPDPFFKTEEAAHEAGGTAAEAAIIKSSSPYETGYKVSVAFTGAASNFFMTNMTTREFLSVIHDFAAGDVLEIDTEERTVYINGVNAYNSKGGTSWALLSHGENRIACNPAATIRHIDRYIGL